MESESPTKTDKVKDGLSKLEQQTEQDDAKNLLNDILNEDDSSSSQESGSSEDTKK